MAKSPTITPAEDMRTRWLPSSESMKLARAVLAVDPSASYAVIPMYQPDKRRGVWTVGQAVVTVPGVLLLVRDDDPLSSIRARMLADAASRDAATRAGITQGTAAHATVFPDGVTAVFEDWRL